MSVQEAKETLSGSPGSWGRAPHGPWRSPGLLLALPGLLCDLRQILTLSEP